VSELEFEAEPEPVFVDEATDVTQLQSSEPANKGPHAVSDRFFHPDGTPRELVELRSDAAVEAGWAEHERQAALEPPAGPSALEVADAGPSSEQEYWGDVQAQQQAQAYAAQQEAQQALYARVTHAGAARDVGVTDAAALEQAARAVSEQVGQWVTRQYAQGASSRQVADAAQGYEWQQWLDEAIAAELSQARYERLTEHTAMRRQQRASWEAQRVDYELGLRGPPLGAMDKFPGLQRMASAMQARAGRLAEQRQALDAIVARNRAEAAWRPRSTPRQRKLRN
jgi:hypothetical protein